MYTFGDELNILEIKDNCRANFNKYTRKAFESIPKIENPNILDLGCGTGVPTIEIANLSNGNILAIDSDKECLDWLKQKIKILNYGERISIIHDSIFTVNLPENNYDIILAEGLFNIIGFEKGLLGFSKFLKTNGYFIIHDEFQNREKNYILLKNINMS
ncbi:class I SAM-dependent methyltransferase [candidate division KSB1 bacterium]|nr:class I SAM-dependent methyltransferase [candidate division KSB1 bacterium]